MSTIGRPRHEKVSDAAAGRITANHTAPEKKGTVIEHRNQAVRHCAQAMVKHAPSSKTFHLATRSIRAALSLLTGLKQNGPA